MSDNLVKKRIRISIDNPQLPTGQNIAHYATSYQISKSFRIDQEPDMLLQENLEDSYNKLDWFTVVNIEPNITVYGRARYHFLVNGKIVASEWSRVIPIDGRASGLQMNSNVIITPTVKIDQIDDVIIIKTSDFEVFSGPNKHLATSYLVSDSDMEPKYSRERDEVNLKDITINNPFENGKIYNVEAKHINTYSSESNYGSKLYYNGGNEVTMFELTAPEPFVIDRKFYYRLKIWTTMFKSYNLEIRDNGGNVVKKLENVTNLVNYIFLDNMQKFVKYDIYISLNLSNNTSTEYIKVYTNILTENIIIPNRPTLVYPSKYVELPNTVTSGIACVTTRELFDNKIINTDYKSNSLYLYKEYNNKIQKMKELVKFEGYLDVDYINIFQLPTHDILVDVMVHDTHRQASTMFIKYEYNPISYEFTEMARVVRDDERYSTSITNSMVLLDDGTVYYVPSYLTNPVMLENEEDVRVNLTMFKLDTDTMEITKLTLPKPMKYNISLFRDMDNNIYTIGGSMYPLFKDMYGGEDNDGRRQEYWELQQKDIYKYIVEDDSWELVASLPATGIPKYLYALQCHLRCDGVVVMFNGCHSGPNMNFQNTILFDPYTKKCKIEKTNLKANYPIRNNIVYINGNIERTSSKTIDPQSVLVYYSDTYTVSDKPEIEDVDIDALDLVVNDGQEVNIEDIYKYNSIKIYGSGKVNWYRPQGITRLDSRTLVLYEDISVTQQEFYKQNYKQVIILDGARLTITAEENFKDLPSRPLPPRVSGEYVKSEEDKQRQYEKENPVIPDRNVNRSYTPTLVLEQTAKSTPPPVFVPPPPRTKIVRVPNPIPVYYSSIPGYDRNADSKWERFWKTDKWRRARANNAERDRRIHENNRFNNYVKQYGANGSTVIEYHTTMGNTIRVERVIQWQGY